MYLKPEKGSTNGAEPPRVGLYGSTFPGKRRTQNDQEGMEIYVSLIEPNLFYDCRVSALPKGNKLLRKEHDLLG